MGAERYHPGRDEVTGAVVRHIGPHLQEPVSEHQQKVKRARSIYHFCTSIDTLSTTSLKEDMHATGPAYKHIQMCTHTYAQYTHAHVQMCARTHSAQQHTHTYKCVHTCIHMYTPMYTHTRVHIRIHTNTDAGFCTSGAPSSSTDSSTDTAVPAGRALSCSLRWEHGSKECGLTQTSQVCDCPKQLHSLQALQGLLPGGCHRMTPSLCGTR